MGKLLSIILVKHNITYTVVESTGNLGIPLSNGSWTGMSGVLQRNEADIMLGPPLMSSSRLQIMDFSAPLMFDQTTILSRFSSTSASKTFHFIKCFELNVWLLLIATLFLYFSLCLLRHRFFHHNFNFQTIINCFMFHIEKIFATCKLTLLMFTYFNLPIFI